MARYNSHFDTLIKVRKYRQDLVHRELIEQENLLSLEETQLRQWIEESETAIKRLTECQKSGGSSNELQGYYPFIKRQRSKIKAQQKKIEEITQSVEEKRNELNEVVQEKKIVEKIEARQKEAYFASVKKKEALLLDEIGGRLKRKIK